MPRPLQTFPLYFVFQRYNLELVTKVFIPYSISLVTSFISLQKSHVAKDCPFISFVRSQYLLLWSFENLPLQRHSPFWFFVSDHLQYITLLQMYIPIRSFKMPLTVCLFLSRNPPRFSPTLWHHLHTLSPLVLLWLFLLSLSYKVDETLLIERNVTFKYLRRLRPGIL